MSARPLRADSPRYSQATAPQAASRPTLAVVAAPRQSSSTMPFVALCLAIIISALAAVLILNTSMARGAYEARDIKIAIADAHQSRSNLVTKLDSNGAPHHLANLASGLGMVPAETVGFVSLSDARVVESGGQ